MHVYCVLIVCQAQCQVLKVSYSHIERPPPPPLPPTNEVDLVIVPIFTGADTEAPKVIADPGTANREWGLHSWNPSQQHT